MTPETDTVVITALHEATAAAQAAAVRRLTGHLAQRAEQSDLLDIAYRTFDSPVGTLLLAATQRGVVRIAFDLGGFDPVLNELAAKVSPRVVKYGARLDPLVRQLDDYFAGRRAGFDLPLDRALSIGFRGDVHRHLSSIAYGTTSSYGAVAEALGRPKAVRAVGTACGHNPIPLVVPCHRVLRSDGSTGQYAGGADVKQSLIDLEAGSAVGGWGQNEV